MASDTTIPSTPLEQKQSYYEVLKVPSTATSEEIKSAYRSLVVRCHPDKLLPTNDADDKEVGNAASVNTVEYELASIDIDDDDESDDSSPYATRDDCTKEHSAQRDSSSPDEAIPQISQEEAIVDATTPSPSKPHSISFHQIQTAYNILRDPSKRRQYDDSLDRNKEREGWKWKGAFEVKLSEMESDMCCVVDDEDESNDECNKDDNKTDEEESIKLQKVFFHPCRCGDTFQIVHEELLESLDTESSCKDEVGGLTNRVWQCESCSLAIRINVDTFM